MGDQIISLLLSFLGAFAIGLLAWSLVDMQRRFVKSGGRHASTGERMVLIVRLSLPYIKGFSSLFARALRKRGIIQEEQNIPGETAPGQYEEKGPREKTGLLKWLYDRTQGRLLAAGSPYGFEVEDYWGFFLFDVVAFSLVGFVMMILTGWVLIFVGFVGMGVLVPISWLSDTINRRRARVRKDLPFALDLLTLSVEAGMDFTAALGKISERLADSPLAQEIDLTVKEINMGRQRADALRGMGKRLNMHEVRTVVSALIQADQLGTGLGGVLRIQAEDVRTRRFQSAEKRAGETPTKMLFPLVAFIFPVTFLMVASPLLIKVIEMLLAGD